MSDLHTLFLLLLLGAVVGLWLKFSAGRDRAVREARRQCERHGLQLLDETVGLRALRLRRVNGWQAIERCYGFDVSIDGDDREPGRLWMIGNAMTGLSLPTVKLVSPQEAVASLLATASTSNVVPIDRQRQTNNRPH
ncbi:DUF3301 domain-containing protein [Rhodanobacter sp. L36]|uniref:DUF3301 domain-containing protein n=1 Tax=Rhodanobacter sp. L36 TaxID=1747221 RepID=UPI00131D6F8B|nr:DUF3301 domain-containing protein [Rhodanobacter sp. L36]